MTAPQIKGYCPGALRPMLSGDGLVVRLRPFNGHLTPQQAAGIAALSDEFGNGIIDLSSRANVQLRGVSPETHLPLINSLRPLGLIDSSEAIESRRNIVMSPFWHDGDGTNDLATRLIAALSQMDAPALPNKFGFAIDIGPTPVLQTTSADIRLERDENGGLILVADGMRTGKPVTDAESIDEVMALAQWFMATRGRQNRMRKLPHGPLLPEATRNRQNQSYKPAPGANPQGMLVAPAFGQLTAATLAQLSTIGALRVTPWRMVLIEDVQTLPQIDGVIVDPADPLLRITACTGAPDCAQALGETRTLARRLAPHMRPTQAVHVSGCAKGCAHPKPAMLTLTATAQGFDLVNQGRAGDTPAATALSSTDIIKAL